MYVHIEYGLITCYRKHNRFLPNYVRVVATDVAPYNTVRQMYGKDH